MTSSTRYSPPTVKSEGVGERVSQLRSLVRRDQQQPKWLVVGDINLYYRAALGHPDGANRHIIEASQAGVLVLVSSKEIRLETLEVLRRPDSRLGFDEAEDILEAMCSGVRYVQPGPHDPQYVDVVNDPDDVIVLRTAAGIYFHDDLSPHDRRFIVSGDTRAFPRGRNWYGFRYMTAKEFWQELSEAD